MKKQKKELRRKFNSTKLVRFDENNKSEQNLLLQPGKRYSNNLIWQNHKYQTSKFKIDLYRFLRDNIPLLHACIWTWSSTPSQT